MAGTAPAHGGSMSDPNLFFSDGWTLAHTGWTIVFLIMMLWILWDSSGRPKL